MTKFCGNPSASSTAPFFGQKGWFGCSPAPGAFLPAGYALPPFEGQFTFWWLSQYWFQKGVFLLRIRTFAVQKGGSLLALWQKTARGSSTIDIMRTTARFWQGDMDPRHGLSSLDVRDRGGGSLAVGQGRARKKQAAPSFPVVENSIYLRTLAFSALTQPVVVEPASPLLPSAGDSRTKIFAMGPSYLALLS